MDRIKKFLKLDTVKKYKSASGETRVATHLDMYASDFVRTSLVSGWRSWPEGYAEVSRNAWTDSYSAQFQIISYVPAGVNVKSQQIDKLLYWYTMVYCVYILSFFWWLCLTWPIQVGRQLKAHLKSTAAAGPLTVEPDQGLAMCDIGSDSDDSGLEGIAY